MTTLDDILSKDEEIDSLTEFQVVDIWVRSRLAHRSFRENPRDYELADYVENVLVEYHHGVLKEVCLRSFGKSWFDEGLEWSDTDENVWVLFDRMTKDLPRTKLLDGARASLKRTLRTTGMPDSVVARGRLNYYLE
jgi:hypothetical protein